MLPISNFFQPLYARPRSLVLPPPAATTPSTDTAVSLGKYVAPLTGQPIGVRQFVKDLARLPSDSLPEVFKGMSADLGMMTGAVVVHYAHVALKALWEKVTSDQRLSLVSTLSQRDLDVALQLLKGSKRRSLSSDEKSSIASALLSRVRDSKDPVKSVHEMMALAGKSSDRHVAQALYSAVAEGCSYLLASYNDIPSCLVSALDELPVESGDRLLQAIVTRFVEEGRYDNLSVLGNHMNEPEGSTRDCIWVRAYADSLERSLGEIKEKARECMSDGKGDTLRDVIAFHIDLPSLAWRHPDRKERKRLLRVSLDFASAVKHPEIPNRLALLVENLPPDEANVAYRMMLKSGELTLLEKLAIASDTSESVGDMTHENVTLPFLMQAWKHLGPTASGYESQLLVSALISKADFFSDPEDIRALAQLALDVMGNKKEAFYRHDLGIVPFLEEYAPVIVESLDDSGSFVLLARLAEVKLGYSSCTQAVVKHLLRPQEGRTSMEIVGIINQIDTIFEKTEFPITRDVDGVVRSAFAKMMPSGSYCALGYIRGIEAPVIDSRYLQYTAYLDKVRLLHDFVAHFGLEKLPVGVARDLLKGVPKDIIDGYASSVAQAPDVAGVNDLLRVIDFNLQGIPWEATVWKSFIASSNPHSFASSLKNAVADARKSVPSSEEVSDATLYALAAYFRSE